MSNMNIIGIRENPEWLERAVDYFASKWGISRDVYQDSMFHSLTTESPLPRWYLMVKGDEVIGSYGLIVNDFNSRQDLWPWLCGLYVDKHERGKALGSRLLEHGRREAAALGFSKVYLCTDHVGYYEKYGWRYIGMAYALGDSGRIYEADAFRIETARLILRPLVESDAAIVSQLSHQSSGARYMVFDTETDAREWIRWIDNSGDQPCMAFAIERKPDAEIIGVVGVGPKDELKGEVELVYFIGEKYQNNGYATEACKAAIWWTFERAGQDMLSTTVNTENGASRRVLDKLGFISCGTRTLQRKDGAKIYDYFRLYHTDWLPGPEWDAHNLYRAEPMGAFFDTRADGYNQKMLSGENSDEDYKKLGACLPRTGETLEILDIGCGTGIELDYIWARCPGARITCLDLSHGMLDLLLANHPGSHDRVIVVEASYIDWAYPESAFDTVISNSTMHHLWPEEKSAVYRRILGTLKPGGWYIESDFIVDDLMAKQYRRRYEIITAGLSDKAKAGEYHIDIPCTLATQKQLLLDAGFGTVEVLDDEINRGNGAILKAVK